MKFSFLTIFLTFLTIMSAHSAKAGAFIEVDLQNCTPLSDPNFGYSSCVQSAFGDLGYYDDEHTTYYPVVMKRGEGAALDVIGVGLSEVAHNRSQNFRDNYEIIPPINFDLLKYRETENLLHVISQYKIIYVPRAVEESHGALPYVYETQYAVIGEKGLIYEESYLGDMELNSRSIESLAENFEEQME